MRFFPVNWFKQNLMAACFGASVFISPMVSATIVQFDTVMGTFEVNLYDNGTPKTVENFLTYVRAGAYTNTIVHRSVSGFVVQGGGYKYDSPDKLSTVNQNAVVKNEPVYSNLRGTIAMAKGSAVNSATNQWFINTTNNATKLDNNTGGFTVFGEVIGNGMVVVDAIAAVNTLNMGGAFTSIPLRNYTITDNANKVPLTDSHFVVIKSITVLDATVDTAAALTPAPNTLVKKDSGSGSLGLLSLIALGLLALGRKTRLNKA